jgi:molybdenum cofactor cytidylyltransferase
LSRLEAGAVILAAGASSRFGSQKLLAPLEGRPLLQHVLDAVGTAGIHDAVVVLGRDAEDVSGSIRWRSERIARNPQPERGLSASLAVGAAALDPRLQAAVILLGDQPRVSPALIRRLVEIAAGSDRPIVVPRYAGGGGRNPVVLRRDAWHLAAEASGDRGLGPLITARPWLVLEVPVAGGNPDVDTPGDLAAISSAAATPRGGS